MRRRPFTIILVALLFILAGSMGIAYHANELSGEDDQRFEVILALAIRLLAIVCGVMLWLRKNWARWLALAWLLYHVALSLYHSPGELITHAALLAIVSLLLFLPRSNAYFRGD